MHRHVFSHGNIFMRVYVHACTSSRHRLALVAMEGIRKRRAVGRDVATIPLGFALWVSEWKPVSQSVRRAGKSMIGTGALLRPPLNDSCMIDAWLWIVTIEYVVSPLKKKTKNVAILSSTRSEFCNGPLPLVHCHENVNSNFYIYSSNVRCCVPLQHLFWLFHFVNLYNLVCLLSQHRSVTTDIVRCTVFFLSVCLPVCILKLV